MWESAGTVSSSLGLAWRCLFVILEMWDRRDLWALLTRKEMWATPTGLEMWGQDGSGDVELSCTIQRDVGGLGVTLKRCGVERDVTKRDVGVKAVLALEDLSTRFMV